jgi:hypothetical protein
LELKLVSVVLVVGDEAARFAGRGGSWGLTVSVGGARGGSGSEDVYDGRVNVGYGVEGCSEVERGSERSGRTERAAWRVDGLSRSLKIFEEG